MTELVPFDSHAAARETATLILETGSIYTRTSGDPFFFTSGWASPVFVDIKRLISFPAARNRIIALTLASIEHHIGLASYDAIAGCELAGIPFAAIIADRQSRPLIVAKKQARGFGRLAQIEGHFEPGIRIVLLDDLTTDGGTKGRFKTALEDASATVVAIFVVFDYAIFPVSQGAVSLVTLPDIIEAANTTNALDPGALDNLALFANDAAGWSRRNGGIGEVALEHFRLRSNQSAERNLAGDQAVRRCAQRRCGQGGTRRDRGRSRRPSFVSIFQTRTSSGFPASSLIKEKLSR